MRRRTCATSRGARPRTAGAARQGRPRAASARRGGAGPPRLRVQHVARLRGALGEHELAPLREAREHRPGTGQRRPGALERGADVGQLRRAQQQRARRLVEGVPDFMPQVVAQHLVVDGRQPPGRQQRERHRGRPAQRAAQRRIDHVGSGGMAAQHEQRRDLVARERQVGRLERQQPAFDARAGECRRRRGARGDQQPQARRQRGHRFGQQRLQRLGHGLGLVEHQHARGRQRGEQGREVAARECRHVAELLGLRHRQTRTGGRTQVGEEARRVGVGRRQPQPHASLPLRARTTPRGSSCRSRPAPRARRRSRPRRRAATAVGRARGGHRLAAGRRHPAAAGR